MPPKDKPPSGPYAPPYINAHCHIFNVQSMFNMETLKILISRIWASPLGKLAVLVFLALARKHILLAAASTPYAAALEGKEAAPERVDPAAAVEEFLEQGKDLLTEEQWAELRREAGGELTAKAVVEGTNKAEVKLFGWHDNIDKLLATAFDPIPTIAKGYLPDHDLGTCPVIVPLCMDITGQGDHGEEQFMYQTKETIAAAKAFPGQVLPFYGLNTNRGKYLTHFYEQFGAPGTEKPSPFVGVKIYPTEGYAVDDDNMRPILERCNELALPITQHTNNGGFSLVGEEDKGDPARWDTKDMLQEYSRIRIDFAHFGGDDFMHDEQQKRWHDRIKSMMDKYNSDGACRVFADISYNTCGIGKGADSDRYWAELRSVFNAEPQRDGLLWGTDTWLLYISVLESEYIDSFKKSFKEKFRSNEFERISVTNSMRFLGMDGHSPYNKALPNIKRFVDYMWEEQSQLGSPLAPWLQAAFAERKRAKAGSQSGAPS